MSSPAPISLRELRVGTIAGTSERGKENEATFHWPLGMALTPQGDLLVANYLGHNIRIIDTKGVVTTYAGTGQQGFHDGHKESATFSGPSSIVLTPQGDLLVTDVLNNCIRKVSKDGTVTIYAGTGQQGFRNGVKEQATFFYPFGLIRTSQGNYFVLDKGNHSIRMITTNGQVTTYAGCGQAGCKDGPKDKAMFNTPYGICVVPEKLTMRSGSVGAIVPMELYVADSGNHRVCFINGQGNVSTLAGVAGQAGFVDGAKDVAKFNGPRSLLLTPHGDLLVSDQGNQRIRIVETNGLVSTFAGCDRAGCLDGPLERASFSSPSELCLTPSGDLYISDFTNNKIRHIKCPMWDTSSSKSSSSSCPPNFSLSALLSDSCPPQLSDYSISLPSPPRSRPLINVTLPSSMILDLSSSSNPSINVNTLNNNVNNPGLSSTTSSGSTLSASNSSDLIISSPPATIGTTSTNSSDSTSVQVALGGSSSLIGRSWLLHSTVIANRCPTLLSPEVIDQLKATALSEDAFEAFVHYIYCDELLPHLSLSDLCELDFILHMVHLTKLSDHVRWMIHQGLLEVSQVEAQIALLGHVARHCGGSLALVDLILARLRSMRTGVADNMASVFTALRGNESLLIQITAKLLGDSKLHSIESNCNYSVVTSDVNDCSHFGHFASQIESLYYREINPNAKSKTSALSSSSSTFLTSSLGIFAAVAATTTTSSSPLTSSGPKDGSIEGNESPILSSSPLTDSRHHHHHHHNNPHHRRLIEPLSPAPTQAFGLTSHPLSSSLSSSAAEPLNMEQFVDILKVPVCPPDFQLIVEGTSLKCHKAILYGRWPYFARALRMGGVEFHTNTLELPEDTLSPSLMQALLEYFYSNKVCAIETEDDCITLLKHSLLFGFVDLDNEPQPGFETLMSHCRRPLAKPLTPKNCVTVLNTVLKFGNAHQQYKVRSFVARVLPDIMNDDALATELEALGPAENMKILFEQYGRQTNSPARARPSS